MHKKRREELHLIIESLIAKLRSTEDSVTRKNIYNDIASYAKELTLNITLVQQEMQI
jgi:ABC-type transport system substrate-binding protein